MAMPLESFVSLLERLKGRIDKHGALLRQSEALTRYVLIDPLLRELGWDTEDPGSLMPEYRGAGGRADYALMVGGNPAALLEAKKLGAPLASGVAQALNYCNQQGISYMAVTDGDRWELYEVFRQARIDDRKLMSYSIQNDGVYDCAIKALHLWRPNLRLPTPLVSQSIPAGEDIPVSSEPASDGDLGNVVVVNRGDDTDWKPIEEIGNTKSLSPPKAIRWSNGQEIQITGWRGLLREVANKLVAVGNLTKIQCPVKRTEKHYIVNTEPFHKDQVDFSTSYELPSGLFLAVNTYDAAKDSVILLNQCNEDIQTILVKVR